jgi:hypothetical protein
MYANKLRSEDDKKENIYDMFHYIFINFHKLKLQQKFSKP